MPAKLIEGDRALVITGFTKRGDIRRGGLIAIAAAVLFGASTPAAKAIVAGVHPLMLAGLLYLGSAIGLAGSDS